MAAKAASARRINTKVQDEGSARRFTTKVQDAGSRASEIATSLDRLLHDRMRLGIVSALAAGDELSFTDLKTALSATDGNLSVHARKLEEAGYVTCTKTFAGRTPRTDYKLTAAGRRALEKYLDHMDAIIRAARR
jgi:DNA-binding transcriptional ArsR family regulator